MWWLNYFIRPERTDGKGEGSSSYSLCCHHGRRADILTFFNTQKTEQIYIYIYIIKVRQVSYGIWRDHGRIEDLSMVA